MGAKLLNCLGLIGAGASPPFDPATDSQINTRWLASDSTTIDSLVDTVPADKDGSGCGTLTQNQAWKRATLITLNGKTAWEFGTHDVGKNDLLRCGTWTTPRSSLMTYVIFDGSTFDTGTKVLIDGGAATGTASLELSHTAGTLTQIWDANTMAAVTIPSAVCIVCCAYNGTSNFLQVNATRDTDATDTSTASFDDIMVGCASNEASRASVKMFEVGFAIADSDSYETLADNLYAYAQTEYGVT